MTAQTDLITSDREAIRQYADWYSRQGYQVSIEPAPRELPAFLRTLSPNMIASRDGENVVVEMLAGEFSAGCRRNVILEEPNSNVGVTILSVTVSAEIEQQLSGIGDVRCRVAVRELVLVGHRAGCPSSVWNVE